MDRTQRNRTAGLLRLLAEKMDLNEPLRDAHLAKAGWISRQAICNQRTKNGGELQFTNPGTALALILLACERGYTDDVLTILNDHVFPSVKTGTLARAASIYPDLSLEEAEMLVTHEASFLKAGRNTLQPELIRVLITAFRAPSN